MGWVKTVFLIFLLSVVITIGINIGYASQPETISQQVAYLRTITPFTPQGEHFNYIVAEYNDSTLRKLIKNNVRNTILYTARNSYPTYYNPAIRYDTLPIPTAQNRYTYTVEAFREVSAIPYIGNYSLKIKNGANCLRKSEAISHLLNKRGIPNIISLTWPRGGGVGHAYIFAYLGGVWIPLDGTTQKISTASEEFNRGWGGNLTWVYRKITTIYNSSRIGHTLFWNNIYSLTDNSSVSFSHRNLQRILNLPPPLYSPTEYFQ